MRDCNPSCNQRRGQLLPTLLLATALFATLSFPLLSQEGFDERYYVDGRASHASDSNSGSGNSPLKTISEAARRAVENKIDGRSTNVIVRPGIYRESVNLATFTNYPSNQPNNQERMVFEGQPAGEAYIVGSEQWDGWSRNGDRWTHEWYYNWGVAPNPTNGDREVPTIVRRREIIFVNGKLYRQVLSQGELTNETYHIDENANRVTVKAPSNLDLNEASVEVGVRESLVEVVWENNVTFKGFAFRYAATHWEDAFAAVRFSHVRNGAVENSTVDWNNGRGLYMGESRDVRLSGVKMNNNGWDGWGFWKIIGLTSINGETSYNNWRGGYGGYTGWSVGNKVLTTHGAVIKNHKAIRNQSRGLWFDYNNRDIVLDNISVFENERDGLFLEANNGPIHFIDAKICDNQGFGILAANSEATYMDDSLICNNREGAIRVTGESYGRSVKDWQTEKREDIYTKNWRFDANVLLGRDNPTGDDDLLFSTSLNSDDWNLYKATLKSEKNKYDHQVDLEVFQVSGGRLLEFSEWQEELSPQEATSSFGSQLAITLIDLDFHADNSGTELRWTAEADSDQEYFEVEQLEQEDWNMISRIGAEVGVAAYSQPVARLRPGKNAFRLKLHHLDGTVTYSPKLEIIEQPKDFLYLSSVYPNPAGDHLEVVVHTPIAEEVTVQMFDATGRLIKTLLRGDAVADQSWVVDTDLSDLATGMYLVRVSGKRGQESRAIMVTR